MPETTITLHRIELPPRYCRSCGLRIRQDDQALITGRQGDTGVKAEPTCHHCQSMLWRVHRFWMVRTQRFRPVED